MVFVRACVSSGEVGGQSKIFDMVVRVQITLDIFSTWGVSAPPSVSLVCE